MSWRYITFTYEVPSDWDDKETSESEDTMVDFCAAMIGCDCDEESTECVARWFATMGDVDDDDDDDGSVMPSLPSTGF